MRFSLLPKSALIPIVLAVTFFTGGCSETAHPPAAISLDEIPAAFAKAFASAQGETKELSAGVIAAVQSKEFTKAGVALDALAKQPGLSKIQVQTVVGAAMTVNTTLREAETKGDPQAAEILNYRRMTK